MSGAWTNDQTNEIVVYDPVTGNPIIVLGQQGDNYIQLKDENGNTVASIDQDGNATFQSVNITGDLVVGGGNLYDDLLPLSAKGYVAAAYTRVQSASTVGTTELGLFELDTVLEDQRNYMLSTGTMILKGTVLNDVFAAHIRQAYATSPTITSNIAMIAATPVNTINSDRQNLEMNFPFTCDSTSTIDNTTNFSPGDCRWLLSIQQLSGTGTGQISTGTSSYNPYGLFLIDQGPLVQNTLVPNTGGGGTSPVTQKTKTYNCTWSGSYLADNSYTVGGSATRAYQGDDNAGDGNRKSMLGFPFSTIVADMAGSTVQSCKLTIYYQHWWATAGGTAIVGTHNVSNTSHPTTFSGTTNRVQKTGVPNPGSVTIDLGVTIGQNFRDGTAKGIVLGPGPSSSTTYYGYATGFGGSPNPPTLQITFTN